MGYRIEPVQVEVLFQIQSINEGLYDINYIIFTRTSNDGGKVGDMPRLLVIDYRHIV